LISIIIPTFNQIDVTKQCLESIEAFTPEEHEIIFVDNGSTDGTWQWIRMEMFKHPNYKLIKNETNLGFPVAVNQGAKVAQGEYLCFLNNDTVVSKEWLKGLKECLDSFTDVAIVGPRTNYVSGPQAVTDTTGYDTLLKYVSYAENFRKAYKGLYWPFWRIAFCQFMRRDVFEKLGGWDERFSPGNWEDDDLCLRACLAGYRNMICSDVFIHHHGSLTCRTMDFGNLLETNKKKFDEKWKSENTISAVLIVKNEEKNIGDCLVNLSWQVDEIIVVDTGSTDKTKEIASRVPNVKIYDFEWCDDFSAARNFANSKATQDWILSVDADEVITGLDKLELRPYHAYRITTRTYSNDTLLANCQDNAGEYREREQGTRWFPSTKIRLWPRDSRIAFEYPVHEIVENSVYFLGMQVVDCNEIVVHHYGRMDANYETEHGEQYYALIQKQMESGKNDTRSLEQLALAAQGLKKWADARKFWLELLKIDPTSNMAMFNLGHCYAEDQKWTEALECSRKALLVEPDNRDILMNVAACEAMVGDYELAKKICADLIEKYPNYPLPKGLLNALEISKQQIGGEINGNSSVNSN
jgi:GT2 family glycosyltransferase/tetratricopeptide (TPR) repeat protein